MINLNEKLEKSVISSLNASIEKHGKEEKVLGYTLSIKCEVPSRFLQDMAINQELDYENLIWLEDGSLKRHFIKQIAFSRVFENHIMKIDLSLVSDQVMFFHNVTLKDFKSIPVFGRNIILEFKVYFTPTPTEVEFINRAILLTSVDINFEASKDDQLELE